MGMFDSFFPAAPALPDRVTGQPAGMFGTLLQPTPPAPVGPGGLQAPPSDPNAVAGQTIINPGAPPPAPPPPPPSLADQMLSGARNMVDQSGKLLEGGLRAGSAALGAITDQVLGQGTSDAAAANLAHFTNAFTGDAPIKLSALGAYGWNHAFGPGNATFDDALNYERRAVDRTYAANPIASNVGTGLGLVGGAMGIQKGLTAGGEYLAEKGMPVAANALSWMTRPAAVVAKDAPLVAKMGTGMGNVGRAAVLGGTVAGLQSELEAPNLDSRLGVSVLGGAVLGPVAGKAFGMAAEAVAPYAIKLANALKVPLSTMNPQTLALARAIGVDIKPGTADAPDANPEALRMFQALYPVFKTMGDAARQAVISNLAKITGYKAPLLAATSQTEGAAANALGTKYPAIGEAMQGAARDLQAVRPELQRALIAGADKPVPGQLALPAPVGTPAPPPAGPRLAAVPGTKSPDVQDLLAVTKARNANMDTARKDAAAAGADWATTKVPMVVDDLETLNRKSVRAALAGADEDGRLLNRYNKAIEDLTDADGNPLPGATSNRLSVDDIDNIRQTVGQYANSAENSHRAGSINETRDAVADLGTRASETYAGALKNYRSDSDYVRGFKLAQSGKDTASLEAGNANIRGMDTPEFKAGQSSGLKARLVGQAGASEAGAADTAKALAENATTSRAVADTMGPAAAARMSGGSSALQDAQAALNRAAPKALEHQVEPDVAAAAAGGVGAAAVGMTKTAAAQLMGVAKAMIGRSNMSPAAQKLVTDMLLSKDPLVQKQALAFMVKMGASQTEMKTLQSLVGAGFAGGIANQAATGKR